MSDNNNTTENTNNTDNSTNNNKNNAKENKIKKESFFKRHSTFILYSIICITFLLVLICKYSKYTNESKTLIENSIKQFELNSQIQLSNYYEFLKETITNESFENKEFIKNTLEEAFKPNIDLLRETLKDSKDFSINTVTFWLAFLSLIMIIFTILGVYANNKIMESNQKQSELIIKETKLESNKTLEELNKKAQEMELTLKKIEEQTKQSKINADKSKVSELFARASNEEINKNYDEAIKFYTEALEIEQKNITVLNNRGNVYSYKYRETKDEEYFNKALEDYNNAFINDNDLYYKYINISILLVNKYEITKKSIVQTEKYLNEGLKLYPNNLELINNYGIFSYLKYKENKTINDLNNSRKYLEKALNDIRIKKNIGETYYYLHLVYDEYAELEENISGYSKVECEKKSNKYLQKSKDLGYKHFIEK